MTQAKVKFASFEAYLAWSDDPENYLEGRFELVDGELVEVPPESGLNRTIANRLFFLLVAAGIVPLELAHPGQCEVQVPVLQPRDPANRYPDLVILEAVHLTLTQKRLTITLDMPPPQLVAEVLSPGKQNRDRDLVRKRDQYAARGIPEYWLVDPEAQTVTVLQLQNGSYGEVGRFQGNKNIGSPMFPDLQLTAMQLFQVAQ
ncbi:Uma2 family endonuclease [Stenomitos frigidus]|uniref:Uma2 family endonuclease n=1 Tax=Stenomitos frigidus ULC18 TaxID=2107698 RepID=A0A2T1DU79_9CYAN|nr:Uma2 family endonuclease [Stenomitos frigidus]PSB24047.1 Uma2 family endonuclease [Stenomitos frigidus ULC18]